MKNSSNIPFSTFRPQLDDLIVKNLRDSNRVKRYKIVYKYNSLDCSIRQSSLDIEHEVRLEIVREITMDLYKA